MVDTTSPTCNRSAGRACRVRAQAPAAPATVAVLHLLTEDGGLAGVIQAEHQYSGFFFTKIAEHARQPDPHCAIQAPASYWGSPTAVEAVCKWLATYSK